MNNKTKIIKDANSVKNKTSELKNLLNEYNIKVEKKQQVKHILNQIKDRVFLNINK